MAQDIMVFDVTVVQGGTASAPQVFALAMPARRVDGVEVVIPAGVRSTVHWALGSAGTRVIPSNAGAYVAGDDEVVRWPLSGYWNSGAWQLQAYNTGGFPHTLQIRFLLSLVQGAASSAPALIAASSLSSG
jgi:hypothetical protein